MTWFMQEQILSVINLFSHNGTQIEKKKETKAVWEMKLNEQIKKPREPAKSPRKRKETMEWNNKKKKKKKKKQWQKRKLTIKLEEINQKILGKEYRLKIYRNRIKWYKQNRIFQNDNRKFNQLVYGEIEQAKANETKYFLV